MMGRLVVLLIAANLAWAAWEQGWLDFVGLGGADRQAEPERIQRQVRPEAMTLRPRQGPPAEAPVSPMAPTPAPEPSTPETAPPAIEAPVPQAEASVTAAASAAPSVSGACLQAGVFDDKQIEVVRRAAAILPTSSWRVDQVTLPGRWMVYVGKLADADAVRSRRAELRALGVDTDRPAPALEPGLSLGRFSSPDQAQRSLASLTKKGVQAARVIQERPDVPGYVLRLPNADAALRQQAARGLRGTLAGKELRACDAAKG